jgi:tetratricopeptide (TPR) repeat protein
MLYEQKKYDEAVAKLQKASELDLNDAPTYNGLGFVLYEQKKYDEAAVNFQKAIELDPKYALAYSSYEEAKRKASKAHDRSK